VIRVKKFIINSIIFILIFCGTILISWSLFLEDVVVPYLAHVEIIDHEFDINLENAQRDLTPDATFDFDVVDNLGVMGLLPYLENEIFPIGEIIIPSLELNLPILFGVSGTHVARGAATMHPWQQMGEGNYALASHNMHVPTVLFSDIHHLRVGDQMFLRDAHYVYAYTVSIANLVIYPTQSYVVDDVPGERLLTLITCNPDGTMRVMVQGEFVERIPISQAGDVVVLDDDENDEANDAGEGQGRITLGEIIDNSGADAPWLPIAATVVAALILSLLATVVKRKKKEK